MRNKLGQYTSGIAGTWTYKHVHLIITLSLVVSLLWLGLDLQQYVPQAQAISYESVQVCEGLECEIERRAARILNDSMQFHKEAARIEAIREINTDMLGMLSDSPHVDYKELQNTYGY